MDVVRAKVDASALNSAVRMGRKQGWNNAIDAAQNTASAKGWSGNQAKRCDDYTAGGYDCADSIAEDISELKIPM